MGFRLNLATNSCDAVQAGREAWGDGAPEFARQPVEIRMIVQPEGDMVDEPPVFRGQGDLFTIVSDRHNYGSYDTNTMVGYTFVSQATAANHLRLRMHFLESMTYALLAQRHAVPMHAAAVMRNGSGVLLCGPSGAGKSTLAFACARAGWVFVSDDATWLPAGGEDLMAIGRPSTVRFREDAPALFPELARYAAEQRPNGKITIEAPTAHFPAFRTSARCPIHHFVMLGRRAGAVPRMTRLASQTVLEHLLQDMPSYGARVREMYEQTLGRLLDVAAWRMEYETLNNALCLLSNLTNA